MGARAIKSDKAQMDDVGEGVVVLQLGQALLGSMKPYCSIALPAWPLSLFCKWALPWLQCQRCRTHRSRWQSEHKLRGRDLPAFRSVRLRG